jgi:hypothetical protein
LKRRRRSHEHNFGVRRLGFGRWKSRAHVHNNDGFHLLTVF